jgi:lipoprotein-anchoring transpeptidase ErfK/SrfK
MRLEEQEICEIRSSSAREEEVMCPRLGRREFLAGLAAALAGAGGAGTAVAGVADRRRRYNFGVATVRGMAAQSGYRGMEIVAYETRERPGTLIVVTDERALYRVLPGGRAERYGVGVGREGFQWKGVAWVRRKAKWPEWRPPAEMIEREWRLYRRRLPTVMKGGPDNPLGARALYLYQGNRDTLYRIHGTNQPQTIGRAVSSGCIRLLNEEIIELYEKVPLGTRVVVT